MIMEYWDREIETISRDDLTALQVERLRETVGIALQSPFYSKRLGDGGVTVDGIGSLDDLKRIPFTTKEDLRISYHRALRANRPSFFIRGRISRIGPILLPGAFS